MALMLDKIKIDESLRFPDPKNFHLEASTFGGVNYLNPKWADKAFQYFKESLPKTNMAILLKSNILRELTIAYDNTGDLKLKKIIKEVENTSVVI